jgi:hypothetical protein
MGRSFDQNRGDSDMTIASRPVPLRAEASLLIDDRIAQQHAAIDETALHGGSTLELRRKLAELLIEKEDQRAAQRGVRREMERNQTIELEESRKRAFSQSTISLDGIEPAANAAVEALRRTAQTLAYLRALEQQALQPALRHATPRQRDQALDLYRRAGFLRQLNIEFWLTDKMVKEYEDVCKEVPSRVAKARVVVQEILAPSTSDDFEPPEAA